MRKFVICNLIIITALFISSCTYTTGSGDILTEKRSIDAFRGIHVNGGFNVEVRSGSDASLTLEADDNLIDDIETTVDNGILKIRCTKKNLRNQNFKVYLTTSALTSIKASAGADIKVKDIFASEKFEVAASSGATITATVRTPYVMADASSAGDINLAGQTKEFNAEVSSGGDLEAFELQSETGKVSASSGSNAKVHASVSLTANASSGASIRYRGGASITKSVSSGASVEKN